MERAAARQQSIKPGMEGGQRSRTPSLHAGRYPRGSAGAPAVETVLSFRSRARWRVPRAGHEDRRGWAAAGHAGGNQPEIHAQPGKKLLPQRGAVVSQQGMKTIKSKSLPVALSSHPSITFLPIAHICLISFHLMTSSSTVNKTSNSDDMADVYQTLDLSELCPLEEDFLCLRLLFWICFFPPSVFIFVFVCFKCMHFI